MKSTLDAFWQAAADFVQLHHAAADRAVAPSLLAPHLGHWCQSYRDQLEGKYDWIVIHKGMVPETVANGLLTACLAMEPVFANEVFVIFVARDHCNGTAPVPPLPPADAHYKSLLDIIAARGVQGSAATGDRRMLREEIKSVLEDLLSPVVSGKPNLERLAMQLKELPAIMLNIKNFGYELALRLNPQLDATPPPAAPQRIELRSKATTRRDIDSPWFAYWCARLCIKPLYHRKIWELCYVSQVIWQTIDFEKSPAGIGFGCGLEPLPSLFAAMGASITVTDLDPVLVAGKGWQETAQHAASLEKIYYKGIVNAETFRKKVSLKYIDMNAIPADLDGLYDFCWSVCSLEHLGSIQHGLDFIEQSLRVLKPGGTAIHTTEFDFTGHGDPIPDWPTVVFRRHHFEQIAAKLTTRGYKIAPLDFHTGNTPVDRFIDLPPYALQEECPPGYHWGSLSRNSALKISVDGIPTTCFGLIITAPAA